jgi:hypothetical protein
MKQTELWDRLWGETKVILGIAGGITTALWIKRLIERLSGNHIIDKDIVEHGLEKKLPVPVTAPLQPSSPASSALPSSWGGHARSESPWWRTNGKREPGGGEVLVDGWEGPIQVRYSAKYETREGLTLYDHDTELNPHHECGSCPLLKARTACRDCEWYVDRGSYVFDPQCAALMKLEESPEDFTTSVSEVKRLMELS